MDKKSPDLADAAIDCELVPMTESAMRALIRQGKRESGFLQVPAKVMAQLEVRGVSREAWCVLCTLQRLEFKAERKGEPIKLTNKALGMFGGTRSIKARGLDELLARGIVQSYTKTLKGSPLVRLNMSLQK
jgi:hypothetical protein